MSTERETPEMAARLAVVRSARAKLQDRHFLWIIDAAMDHFATSVKSTEAEILRFQGLPDAPIFTRYGKDRGSDQQGTTRARELPRLHAALGEYYAILEFLQAMKDAESLRSAEQFAAGFDWSQVGRGPHRRGRRGT